MRNLKRALIIWLRIAIIQLKDIVSLRAFSFAHSTKSASTLPYDISITQKINPSKTLAEKVNNVTVGANRIAKITLQPKQILSLWNVIGAPTTSNGFQESRAIVAGKLEMQSGGGLCQLSGIVYHLALLGGLEILERHNHSVDIYTEEERFTPLGSDATVVYGYKDLRVKNSKPYPISFQITVDNTQAVGKLLSAQPITPQKVLFQREDYPTGIRVKTILEEGNSVIAESWYKLKP